MDEHEEAADAANQRRNGPQPRKAGSCFGAPLGGGSLDGRQKAAVLNCARGERLQSKERQLERERLSKGLVRYPCDVQHGIRDASGPWSIGARIHHRPGRRPSSRERDWQGRLGGGELSVERVARRRPHAHPRSKLSPPRGEIERQGAVVSVYRDARDALVHRLRYRVRDAGLQLSAAPVLTKRVACEEEGEEILALEQPRGVEALKEWTHERESFAQQPTLWGQPGGHSGTA
mmetsp:Transcript_11086/g.36710  ORF Transcript_11086/g.36710 Transcript_11086/m.36710 type:complete len:233 (+) Transcript_11086:382-1080(+)